MYILGKNSWFQQYCSGKLIRVLSGLQQVPAHHTHRNGNWAATLMLRSLFQLLHIACLLPWVVVVVVVVSSSTSGKVYSPGDPVEGDRSAGQRQESLDTVYGTT